jgi:glutathione S-transferase
MANDLNGELWGHSLSAPTMKVRLLFEEWGISYRFKRISLEKGENLLPAFAKINPLGRVPCLVEPDGFCLSESNAILRYTIARHGLSSYLPENPRDRGEVDMWWEFLENHVNNHMGSLIWNKAYAKKFGYPTNDGEIKRAELSLERSLAQLNARLSGRNYLTSHNPTVTDFVSLPYLGFAHLAGVNLSPYSDISAWLRRMEQRSSWNFIKEIMDTELVNIGLG